LDVCVARVLVQLNLQPPRQILSDLCWLNWHDLRNLLISHWNWLLCDPLKLLCYSQEEVAFCVSQGQEFQI